MLVKICMDSIKVTGRIYTNSTHCTVHFKINYVSSKQKAAHIVRLTMKANIVLT